jgi:long-chain acyl-CoA synthetase
VIELANKVSRGLIQLGVEKGDRIALVTGQNRPEWTIIDLGVEQIGAINVPIYPTISTGEYEYILNDAEVKYCFVGRDDLYDKVAATQVPSLKKIFTLDQQPQRPFWKEMFSDENQAEVLRRRDHVLPEELATIIYTSGTTGQPKGVMLSHQNIVSNVISVTSISPLEPGDRALSFLPLCHIFERTASYLYTYRSVEVHFVGTDNLGGEDGDILSVRPHSFNTVPRLLEKVYEKIYHKGMELNGLKKKIFFWALHLTDDFEYDKKYRGWAAVKWAIADKLIFSKWRAALGGNVKGILTGAAACPVKIARVFSAAGIPVREGYGLTETSPGLAIGGYEPGNAMLGAVGPPLKDVRLQIDREEGDYREGEGEILAHGPNIMMGYYKKPEETDAVFKEIDGERWFRTGDVGRFVKGPNGQPFLQITDRKKELLKTSGGKYVAPAPIESKLKEQFLIEQAMVVGEKRKFVSALIIPAHEALRNWCRRQDISWSSAGEVFCHPKVKKKFEALVQEVNQHFSHTEQIKKFRLLDAEWAPLKADGSDAELTPTLKLKRRVITKKHAADIDRMYTENQEG